MERRVLYLQTRFILLEMDVRESKKETAFFLGLQYFWRTKWTKPVCIVYSLQLCSWAGYNFLGIEFTSQRTLIGWPCVFITQATAAKLKNGVGYFHKQPPWAWLRSHACITDMWTNLCFIRGRNRCSKLAMKPNWNLRSVWIARVDNYIRTYRTLVNRAVFRYNL